MAFLQKEHKINDFALDGLHGFDGFRRHVLGNVTQRGGERGHQEMLGAVQHLLVL
jgi:hypothetical protein